MQKNDRRKLIIDTDTAADDAAAMLLAALTPNIEIIGVTVVAGNVEIDQAVRNALMTMEIAGCTAPIYAGAERPFRGEPRETYCVFGTDGMGDHDLIHPKGRAAEGSAVDFILETVRRNPDEVEIVSLGPATNIALAIEKDPETMKRVKRIWSMGTSGLGPGNATPVAEFNVFKDPAAYRCMLEAGIPVTVIGLDMMRGDTDFTDAVLNEMKEMGGRNRFIALACDVLAASNRKYEGRGYVDMCDACAMAAAVWSDFIAESVLCAASCIDAPGETFGQVIFYRTDRLYESCAPVKDPHVTLVTKVNARGYVRRVMETFAK